MASEGHAPGRRSADRPPVGRAHRLVWQALLCFGLAVALGFTWDRAWHTSRPFEDFWSPPHLFIYGMFALCAATVARMVADRAVRQAVGAAFRLPLLRIEVPGSLALLGGGIATIGLAGLLDNAWHTAFGLDETSWSTPHAMLGWGLLLTFHGFLSVWLALRPGGWQGWLTRGGFGLLALGFLTGVPLVQFDRTRELAAAIAALPVLAAEPDAQRTFRLYRAWDLTKQSGLYVPIAAAAAGAGLAVLQRLVARGGLAVLVALLFTAVTMAGERRTAAFFGLAGDARTWAPLPLVPALSVYLVLHWRRLPTRLAWAAAGLVFGLQAGATWGQGPAAGLGAALGMPLGAGLGERLWRVVDQPTRRCVLRLVGAVGLALPLGLGLVDLALRARTA